jgi:uncharacterized membrane protein YuzA (DUF378 family)
VGYLFVNHVGDANSHVSIYRAGSDRVALVGQAVHFAGPTGAVIYEDPPPNAVTSVNEFLTGLHLQHFEHWLLRWFYVLGGLAGCVCIATGFVFFVEKRKRQHAALGLNGARWVDALAVATVTGIVIAAAAILLVNRLLPESLPNRGAWEEGAFWSAWGFTFAHAALRSSAVREMRLSPAWREQCWALAAIALGAVVMNWMTTGDHLLRTIGAGNWPVAGLDLALISVSLIAASTALALKRREVSSQPKASADIPIAGAEADSA